MKKVIGTISLIVFIFINFVFLSGKLIVGSILEKSTVIGLAINIFIGFINIYMNAHCEGD